MGKIYLFLAAGFEEVEALSVVDVARRGGLLLEMVSITGEYMVEGSHGIKVQADKLYEEADFSQADMLVLPGGMPGTKNLEAYAPLMEQIDAFYQAGKWIAAICAAPTIFGHRGMLEGRNACCYPGMESQLKGAVVTQNPVEVSEHVITSRGVGTALELGTTIVSVFQGKDAADALAEKFVYQRI